MPSKSGFFFDATIAFLCIFTVAPFDAAFFSVSSVIISKSDWVGERRRRKVVVVLLFWVSFSYPIFEVLFFEVLFLGFDRF